MYIQAINRTPPDLDIRFGILNTVKKNAEGSKLYGSYRDYDIEIYNNRLLNTTLIYITKFGKWVKSKVKYRDLGKSFTRSYKQKYGAGD